MWNYCQSACCHFAVQIKESFHFVSFQVWQWIPTECNRMASKQQWQKSGGCAPVCSNCFQLSWRSSYFWEAVFPEITMIVTYLLSHQGPSPRKHQISITTSSSENREYSHFWMGGGLDKKREGQDRGSIHKCKHDEGRKLYVVSGVDTVNCKEACGYTLSTAGWGILIRQPSKY